ncbi:hypothetical protein DLD77_03215 [Chitinophaga alhagiae]|uniref:Tetratricopeptide repeat protein n=1 Tax=Chitinophaga alhagiae TaxID=2203219 RepID=A0ABM6W9Y8_9BACT|nr:hypothetical protein [Chitinophaga alhagiae]AWO00777.1 hypothetical protein DLD77_03215 [Chitinophaga alhagiae]
MDIHDLELIDRYLSGDMSLAARQAFEDRLRMEPGLQEELRRRTDSPSTVPVPAQDGDGAMFRARSGVVKLQRFSIAVVSLAIIAALLLFLGPWKRDLSMQYASEAMMTPVERGEEPDSIMEQAALQFNHRHYPAAISSLNAALEQRPHDPYARLYRGLSYLESNQPALSRPDLEIIYNGPSDFKYDGAFYTALSYLKQRNRKTCREWLLKIPEGADNYRRAQQLLKEL